MTAQYHDTKCLICETTIHAPVENFVCNTCHNDDYSTVADFIVKQNARIAALEAQNKNLVEALKEGENVALEAISHVAAANYPHREAEAVQSIEKYFERVLSEVTK